MGVQNSEKQLSLGELERLIFSLQERVGKVAELSHAVNDNILLLRWERNTITTRTPEEKIPDVSHEGLLGDIDVQLCKLDWCIIELGDSLNKIKEDVGQL